MANHQPGAHAGEELHRVGHGHQHGGVSEEDAAAVQRGLHQDVQQSAVLAAALSLALLLLLQSAAEPDESLRGQADAGDADATEGELPAIVLRGKSR